MKHVRSIKIYGAGLACLMTLMFSSGEAAAQEEALFRPWNESTTYEVFVYSFADGNSDGIGDLKGLMNRLDYINDGNKEGGQDLGCDAVWLMPIFPSPTYHKYDVTDYMTVDSQYGDMEDFEALVEACHARGVRVILDLPVNHTSVEHPWFKSAASYIKELKEDEVPDADVCPYADYYNFTREAKAGYAQLPGTSWYYEARFWDGMPDLNLDDQAVREEITQILKFWLEKDVDGFRLDAVTSYYSEDAEESIAFAGWIKDTARSIKEDAYVVCEAWTDQKGYSAYYKSGVDSMFDFAFAGDNGFICKTVKGKKDASFLAEQMQAEEELYGELNAEYINAPFYTNHDMPRSAGYYAYDDGSKVKLALGLNFMMTGNAFLYYGEELGMKGSGKDENKRAPMYWTSDGTAEDICKGPADMDQIEMKFPGEDEQDADPSSILNYVRKAISLRHDFPVIASGLTKPLEEVSGEYICAYVRSNDEDDPVVVLINTGDEEESISIEKLRENIEKVLPDSDPEPDALEAVSLHVSEDETTLDGDAFTIPAYGIEILNF